MSVNGPRIVSVAIQNIIRLDSFGLVMYTFVGLAVGFEAVGFEAVGSEAAGFEAAGSEAVGFEAADDGLVALAVMQSGNPLLSPRLSAAGIEFDYRG